MEIAEIANNRSDYFSPHNALDLARQRGIDAITSRQYFSDQFPNYSEKDIDKYADNFNRTMVAAYDIKRRGSNNPFIIVPQGMSDEKQTWHDYAIVAHEVGHGAMYGSIPRPLRSAAMFGGGYGPSSLGIASSLFGGGIALSAKGDLDLLKASRSISRFGFKLSLLGGIMQMASETWANYFASQKLKELDAPKEAYEPLIGSEISYAGVATEAAGLGLFGVALSRKSLRLGVLSSVGIVGGIAASKYGFNRLVQSGKPYDKIVGHHPGWANKQTEASIESDFTAGKSWTHVKNALKLMGVDVTSESGPGSIKEGLRVWAKLSNREIIANLKKSGIDVIRTSDKNIVAQSMVFRMNKNIKYSPVQRFILKNFEQQTIAYNPINVRSLFKSGYKTRTESVLKFTLAHEALETSVSLEAINREEDEISSIRRVWRGRRPIKPRTAEAKKTLDWSHGDIGVITGEKRFMESLALDSTSFWGWRRQWGYQTENLIQTGKLKTRENGTVESVLSADVKYDKKFSDKYHKILNLGIKNNNISSTQEISRVMQNHVNKDLAKSIMNRTTINHNKSTAGKKAWSGVKRTLRKLIRRI